MKKASVNILLMLLFTFSAAVAQEFDWEYDVPYVPTRTEVLDVMLSMAKITKSDVLYDLGCGDGRIVVTAAKRSGCRGVGIDINPVRIGESRENADKEKIADRVRFIEQDLFAADISEATVVTLYLLPDVNLKLRPNLIAQLKPGTRVVSHNYSMGEWEPDDFKELEAGNTTHYVYYWVVPANVSGRWQVTVTSSGGNPAASERNSASKTYDLVLSQMFQQIVGAIHELPIKKAGATSGPVGEFTLSGAERNTVVFSVDGASGAGSVMKFEGQVNGDLMTGVAMISAGGSTTKASWKAVRTPGTRKAIDGTEVK